MFLDVTPSFFGGMEVVELDDGRMNRRKDHGGNSESSRRRGCEEKQRANDFGRKSDRGVFFGFP